jgi:hypothetical protein
MLNHIAVMMRGHVRTFRKIYPRIFEFYESIAKNVDYYFITWQGSQVNTNNRQIFENRNLVAQVFMQPNIDFGADSYKSSSYLAYMLLPYKHAREKEVYYDLVFDTRPDVIPVKLPNRPIFTPENNTLYVTQFDLHPNFRYNFYDIAVQDWFMAMSSKVYDQMAERFICYNDQGVQITIRTYAEENNINICTMPYQGYMIRPNVLDQLVDDKVPLDFNFNNNIANWHSMPSDKKIEYCMKLGIPLTDYQTGSTTCSI